MHFGHDYLFRKVIVVFGVLPSHVSLVNVKFTVDWCPVTVKLF